MHCTHLYEVPLLLNFTQGEKFIYFNTFAVFLLLLLVRLKVSCILPDNHIYIGKNYIKNAKGLICQSETRLDQTRLMTLVNLRHIFRKYTIFANE